MIFALFGKLPPLMRGPVLTLIKSTGGMNAGDPDELHEQLAKVVQLLSKALELDHEHDFGPEGCQCTSTNSAEVQQGISGGVNEERKEYTGGSDGIPIQGGVLSGENTSTNSDSRHEAEVQSSVRTKRLGNETHQEV